MRFLTLACAMAAWPAPFVRAEEAARQAQTVDPAQDLVQARWHDGCHGVSMREPAGMAREGMTACWTSHEAGADTSIFAQFILPPARLDDRPPEKLSIAATKKQLWEDLAAGRGRVEGLPQFGREFLVGKHPCVVFYAVQQPTTRVKAQAVSDAFLQGVGILQVNPHCQLVLRLSCRIPAGMKQEMPALEAARRRFEAMLSSAQTTPEALLVAARKAQLARGEKAMDLLAASGAAPPRTLLLRVVRAGADIGWMRLDLRHQDAAWYRAHPPGADAADGLRAPGLMVRAQTHIDGGSDQRAQTVDTAQEYFKADPAKVAPEMREALAKRASEEARDAARARGIRGDAVEEAAAKAAATAARSDRFSHESWQRVVTVRVGGKTAQSSSEFGFLAAPSGDNPAARLRLEWAGSTPPELANFFSNPSWRERLEEQDRRLDHMLAEQDGGPGAAAGVPAFEGKDKGGALSGDRKLAQWGMPLDQPCLSQAHLWLMPWLLPKGEAQSCAFFAYSPQAHQPGLCLFTVKPGEAGACDIAFRPAYDQPEQVFSFDPDGSLRRIRLPNGTELLPTTVEEMARIWKVDQPPKPASK